MTLLSMFRVLHYRFSGAHDAVIGTLNGNRAREEIEGLVGFFVDTQALRIRVDDTTPLRDVLVATQETVTRAFDNQDVSFDRVVSALHPMRNLSKNPLVQVIFAVHTFTYDFSDVLPGLTTEASDPDPTTRMDLEMHMYKQGDGRYKGQLFFSSDLYSPAWADNLCDSFVELIEMAMISIDVKISTVGFRNVHQRLDKMGLLSDNQSAYPLERTVNDLLQEIVTERPTAVAVVDSMCSMTYGALDLASDKIADAIVEILDHPVSETTIGIFAHRSALNVAAMYGVLKAGLAYVPLDPALPSARLDALLSADPNGLKIVLKCTSQTLPDVDLSGRIVLDVDRIISHGEATTASLIGYLPKLLLHRRLTRKWLPVTPRSLAYVMYTSGSTGKPKGVMVEHRGIVRLVRKTNITNIQPGHTVAHLSALSFDASTFEIFSTLSNGGTLVCIDKDTLLDPHALSAFSQVNNIQIAYMTAALFSQYVRTAPRFLCKLDLLITGGDIVEVKDVREAYRLGVKRIIDAFGPTEVCVSVDYRVDGINE